MGGDSENGTDSDAGSDGSRGSGRTADKLSTTTRGSRGSWGSGESRGENPQPPFVACILDADTSSTRRDPRGQSGAAARPGRLEAEGAAAPQQHISSEWELAPNDGAAGFQVLFGGRGKRGQGGGGVCSGSGGLAFKGVEGAVGKRSGGSTGSGVDTKLATRYSAPLIPASENMIRL